MERAIELANRAAALDEVPVGAVIYRGAEIIAEAHNTRETDADPVGHAELLAIRLAARRLGRWRLSGCSLAVTLEPCPMCAGALVNARIDRLVYGARDPKAGACGSLFRIPTDVRLNHRVEIIEGVMAKECGKLLTDFFRTKRQLTRERRAKAG
ncbi:MAG: nucleoside deaminase [Phycisphaeraceae bacterium]|nr:MAG: nucleoside deaminase [Phycisphaeraceae bacterium]